MYGMDGIVESVLIAVAAVGLLVTVIWVMRLKTRGALRMLLSALSGGLVIAFLSAFNILVLPLNLFNMALIGVLGLPGAGIVIAAALLL